MENDWSYPATYWLIWQLHAVMSHFQNLHIHCLSKKTPLVPVTSGPCSWSLRTRGRGVLPSPALSLSPAFRGSLTRTQEASPSILCIPKAPVDFPINFRATIQPWRSICWPPLSERVECCSDFRPKHSHFFLSLEPTWFLAKDWTHSGKAIPYRLPRVYCNC